MIYPVDSAIQLLRTTEATLKQAMNSKRIELDQTRTPTRQMAGNYARAVSMVFSPTTTIYHPSLPGETQQAHLNMYDTEI